MRRFLAAIRFLTIVPVPGTWGTTEADLAGSVPFFPVVGLALGAVAGAVAWALLIAAPPPLAAVAVTLLLVAFSGGLHMDGLSDTADGFLSSRPRERILEIMKDSRVGAMGVIAIVGVLLAKFAALVSVQAAAFWPAALLMPLAGRCAMVMHMALLAYVRPEGLGTVFCRRRPYFSALWATAVLAAACWALFDFRGLAVAGLCVATALVLALLFYRKIGGATGDTFGAACEIVELVPAAALALWPLPVAR
jgi:adenosylcobinamide-GDP ribazoletransferase